MEFWHFSRLHQVDTRAVAHLPKHPFETFKLDQGVTEILGQQGLDHIASPSLDAAREKAEDLLRSHGAGEFLVSEPEIIPLREDDRPPFSSPNFAFGWPDGGNGLLVVPLRFSRELANIERWQRREGVPRTSLFGNEPTGMTTQA